MTKNWSIQSGLLGLAGLALAAIVLTAGCVPDGGGATSDLTTVAGGEEDMATMAADAALPTSGTQTAIFAGGCFWCIEKPFDQLPGVIEAVSGYIDGTGPNPTYETYGRMGYTEAVEIRYDPSKTSYEELLELFWRQMDPTDAGGQFADRGPSYRPGIYYTTEAQREAAEISKTLLAGSGRFVAPIIVPIKPATPFYRAEEYHQNYYEKEPDHYQRYRRGSGREQFIEQYWGKN
jgi:methionine-S-sulfoxide reductase